MASCQRGAPRSTRHALGSLNDAESAAPTAPEARSLDDLVAHYAAAEALHPPLIFAQATPDYDCMVGEKLWQDRSWMWDNH